MHVHFAFAVALIVFRIQRRNPMDVAIGMERI